MSRASSRPTMSKSMPSASAATRMVPGNLLHWTSRGATVQFTIPFDPDSNSTGVTGLIAKTTLGDFLTSWNNYFSDLGTSSFAEEIAFMADEGITTGCGSLTRFCPKDNVSRAQMAVFLTRALDLSDTTPLGFTDIGHLTPTFQDAINALANAGITGGCGTGPSAIARIRR